ncbi:MAG: hypothetical protein J6Z14_14105 [Prevotella sp.]|nr:hypothetical protein [Prevotella sp.]
MDDLRAGKLVHARRYRNSSLGEFLKELHLTEGRSTGFPTIHEELIRPTLSLRLTMSTPTSSFAYLAI